MTQCREVEPVGYRHADLISSGMGMPALVAARPGRAPGHVRGHPRRLGPGAAGATGYLHPQARLRVVPADPAEVERLRALHHVPRGQHNQRPWLNNQAALMDSQEEGIHSDARQPRL
jgi:hypothetical protein